MHTAESMAIGCVIQTISHVFMQPNHPVGLAGVIRASQTHFA